MIPEQISFTKIIILNPNQRKMASKKNCLSGRKKKPLSQTVARKTVHFKRKKP